MNNEEERLNEKQLNNAKLLFHKERTAFAILSDGNLNDYIAFNTKSDGTSDIRDHRQWLEEDFGISDEVFEKVVRGYITGSTIQFYKGSSFSVVEEDRISLKLLNELIELVKKRDKSDYISVQNGIHIGEIGYIWKPIKHLFTVYVK